MWLLNPYRFATGYTPTDASAAAYIAAVEAADGQPLESGVRQAIDQFVIGCKADGIWNAIKASCILAGARTLAGALVPLVGTAPTNFNFVAGDYDRKTGLVGDGSTKYLNSNRANNADPQNSQHLSTWVSQVSFGTGTAFIGTSNEAGRSTLFRGVNGINGNLRATAGVSFFAGTSPLSIGLYGLNRSSSSSINYRVSGVAGTASSTSETPSTANIHVFALNPVSSYSNARFAFYSIGEALDLALLDARVTALMYGIRRTLLEGDFDIDAAAYISRVETADSQDLEPAVRTAINNFVIGCKADGTWNAIKASCILAGARTLAGALQPLVGTAPTNINFVAGDYNRKTGLVGDGSTKYLDSNRNNNADPQGSKHLSAFLTSAGSSGSFHAYISGYDTALTTGSELSRSGSAPTNAFAAVNGAAVTPNSGGGSTGFYGTTRSASNSLIFRVAQSNSTLTSTSATPLNANINIFRRPLNTPVGYTNARLAFYSIGMSLDLALLDTRVTALINAFAAAIP